LVQHLQKKGKLCRKKLQQLKLQQLLNESKVLANVTAGLGSVFVALGDHLLKTDGRLAVVLPRSLLSGVAWAETRRLLSSKYSVEYVVVLHEPGHWNFSENTSLGETLVVAKRRKTLDDDRTTFINLWRRPRNTVESLTCSNLILGATPSSLDSISGTSELSSGQVKYGEVISSSTSVWSRACAFAQTDLNRVAYYLAEGKLHLPDKRPVSQSRWFHWAKFQASDRTDEILLMASQFRIASLHTLLFGDTSRILCKPFLCIQISTYLH
jgi:hypothetical protein